MLNKEEIPKEYKMILDKIFSLYKKGVKEKNKETLEKVIEQLSSLSEKYPRFPMASYLMATTYIELDKEEDAIKMFKKTVKISNDSEDVSWLFFNYLWSKGRRDDAIAEARRYLSRNKNKENKRYLQTLNEINLDYDKILSNQKSMRSQNTFTEHDS